MTEDDRRLGMLQSKGLQRVGHDWTTEEQQQQQQAMPASLCLIKSFCTHTHTHKVVCDPSLDLFISPR